MAKHRHFVFISKARAIVKLLVAPGGEAVGCRVGWLKAERLIEQLQRLTGIRT